MARSTAATGDLEAVDAASAWAPGKLILAGEHAVVYGYPAIAAAVSLGTRVTLRAVAGASHLGDSAIRDERVWPALATVVPRAGVAVDIASDLPVGAGMGSSAALAVATVRALLAREGLPETFDEVHRRAFAIERHLHGNPSGVDHAVSALGGVVRYRKQGPEIAALKLPAPLALVVAHTGRPGDTGEMVRRVRERGCDAELAAIGAVTAAVEAAISTGDLAELGRCFHANHALLRAIAVSTPALDSATAAMERAGSPGAKLAGAGGGGVAFGLAWPDDVPRLIAAVEALGMAAFPVVLGGASPACLR